MSSWEMHCFFFSWNKRKYKNTILFVCKVIAIGGDSIPFLGGIFIIC